MKTTFSDALLRYHIQSHLYDILCGHIIMVTGQSALYIVDRTRELQSCSIMINDLQFTTYFESFILGYVEIIGKLHSLFNYSET